MGSWDCYCAICGGPFYGVEVVTKSKSLRLRRRERQQKQKARLAESKKEASSNDNNTEGGEEEEEEQESEVEGEDGYDDKIINEDDAQWTQTLHILGFNKGAPGISKSFISGPGNYDDYGGVNVEAGSDPNFDEGGFFTCYYDFDQGGDIVFPFHWPCYSLLARVLTGAPETSQIDKDHLYNTLNELCEGSSSHLNINYGDPEPPNGQFWECMEGQEFIVSSPEPTLNTANSTKATIASDDFKLPSLFHDVTTNVTSDPFGRLPYDVLYKICLLLPGRSILDFSLASKQVFLVLNSNAGFWRKCIKYHIPWFFELQDLLDDPEIMEGKDMMGLFRWALRETRPRMFMSGPFMSIANRQRIWGVCEIIADKYLKRTQKKASDHEPDYIESMIRKDATCPFMPVVSCPLPQKKDLVPTFWVRSWYEVYGKEKELEMYWETRDAEKALVGISLAPSSERRVFGRDDSEDGVSTRSFFKMKKEEWVKGFILHIPEPDLCEGRRSRHEQATIRQSTYPKGVTVLLNTGKEIDMGQTDVGYPVRPLLGHDGLVIVGVEGHTGPILDKESIISLGLLEAPRPELDNYSIPIQDFRPPEIPLMERWLWKEDYKNILQSRIWEHRGIRLIVPDVLGREALSTVVPDDIVPHEALIWAKDKSDLQSLVSLTGYVIEGGTISSFGPNGQNETRPIHDLCGIRADFASNHDGQQRVIGIRKEPDGTDWQNDHCVNFDINGKDGEIVTEVSVAMHELPKAMKIRTNRDREVYWGEEHAQNWHTLRAPLNMTLIGVVMAFSRPSGYSWETKTFRHLKLSSVAALAMEIE
ncbi:hypothetical protein F5884DRAFT_786754 [Xylogone sp. PMI_703]|nr:hypothetical protein F5884DRAFT_786754 [Xylogone sp. PMI_703]